MHDPPRILIVDDHESNRDILAKRLATQGYDLCQATDGEEALDAAKTLHPDLILLDVMMPKLNGIEVCRRLKGDAALPFMSIILVTAKSDTKDVVVGLDAGADEYLAKPVDHMALLARVRSTLRLKALHDRVLAQAADLAKQAADLANWNQTLEQRVAEQVSEIERIGRLKRFLPPQIAKLVASSHDERMLESHRRAVTVLFCDLRGFTAFSETSEPEEVMLVLREYHTALGVLVDKFEGTVERFVGDGLLAIFNDPLPCPDFARRLQFGAGSGARDPRATSADPDARRHLDGHDQRLLRPAFDPTSRLRRAQGRSGVAAGAHEGGGGPARRGGVPLRPRPGRDVPRRFRWRHYAARLA